LMMWSGAIYRWRRACRRQSGPICHNVEKCAPSPLGKRNTLSTSERRQKRL